MSDDPQTYQAPTNDSGLHNRIAELESELASTKVELRDSKAKAKLAEGLHSKFAGELQKQQIEAYRLKAVIDHYVPAGLDLAQEAKFAVGDVTFDEDGNPTGELSYRPAAPQPLDSQPLAGREDGSLPAAPPPLIPQANPAQSIQRSAEFEPASLATAQRDNWRF